MMSTTRAMTAVRTGASSKRRLFIATKAIVSSNDASPATNRLRNSNAVAFHRGDVKRCLTEKASQTGLYDDSVSRPARDSSRLLSSMATPAHESLNNSADNTNIGETSDDVDLLDGPTMDELHQLASLKSTPLSLSNMFRYAKAEDVIQRLRNAQFLHRELPIRIAQRAVDLLTLPHGLNQTKEVQTTAQIYLKYIQKFREFPEPKTMAQEEKFTDMLETLVLDRTSIPMAIAQGVESLYDNRKEELLDVHRLHEMEEALYRFFTARVGLRFLTEHHVLSSPHPSQRQNKANFRRLQSWIRESDEESDPGEGSFCGLLQEDCNPADEVQRVAAQVIAQTRETYGISPEIEIVDCTREQDKDGKFTYVPTHLQYMLAELLKNSCRATVRRYFDESGLKDDTTTPASTLEASMKRMNRQIADKHLLPPIKVVVVKGAEDVTVKIADRGGGVRRSAMAKLWTFAHSTQSKEYSDSSRDPFTGGQIRGFGLPLARIYARYFGGELTLKSMEGYGVDAYLHLPVLGVACENLPTRVIHSPGNLDSHPIRSGLTKRSSSTTTQSAANRNMAKGATAWLCSEFSSSLSNGALISGALLDRLRPKAL